VITTEPDRRESASGRRDVAFGWRFVDILVAVGRKVSLGRARWVLPYLLILPAAVLIGLLAAGVAYMMWLGFHAFENSAASGGWSLDNYRRLFTGFAASSYRNALVRTTVTSILVTISAVALAVPTAYTIVRTQSRAWRRVALVMLLVPFLMGETVRAIGWVLLLGNEGALTWISRGLGHEIKLLGSSVAVWLGMLQVMFPIATLVMLPAVRRINPDLERAARTMGARPWQVWRRIVVPLARPGILGASLVVLTLSMTEFAIPRILGLGKRPFVANSIQQIYLERGNLNLGSAFSTVLLVTVILMVMIVALFGRERIR
jgi:putative spermidine/putrescine transport system permease protein